MSIKSYFATELYYEPLKNRGAKDFNAEVLDECYRLKEYDRAGKKWSSKHYVGGYTSYASLPHLHQMSSVIGELEQEISKHVNRFAKHLEFDLGQTPLTLSDIWINVMPARTAHSAHIHPLSVISGTYYVKTPRDCAAIKFEDPRLSALMAAPPRKAKCKEIHQPFISYQPQAGRIVLFESWLRHEVPASTNTEDRVSVSFNYSWGR